MQLSSLPSRPLELAELETLNESGRFQSVFPAAVFDLEESDYKLVPVFVLVTDAAAVGAGYDLDTGWTRVDSVEAATAEDDLVEQIETIAQTLQSWARETEQRWADPDDGDALLEAFNE